MNDNDALGVYVSSMKDWRRVIDKRALIESLRLLTTRAAL